MAVTKKKNPRANQDAWTDATSAILRGLDLEAEFSALGVQFTGSGPNASGWQSCHALGREDRNPSAACNTGGLPPLLGRYKDFGGGEELTISLFDLAAKLGRFPDWKAARQHYANIAGVKLPTSEDSRRPSDRIAPMQWIDLLVHNWAKTKPGVTIDAFARAGGLLCKWPAKSAKAAICCALPCFGPHVRDADPTGFVLWNQTGKKLTVWQGKDKPPSESKMLTIGNGWLGSHALRLLHNPDTRAAIKCVWITEGPTDLLALMEAIPENLRDSHLTLCNACGSNEHPNQELLALLSGLNVFVLRDADEPGEAGGKKWSQAVANVAASTRHVRLPYPITVDHGKDLRDFLCEGNDYFALLRLAKETPTFEVVTASSPDAAGTQQPFASGPTAIEADDDPHRLARLYISRRATIDGAPVLRFWRQDWWQWNGRQYQQIAKNDVIAKVTQVIKDEFDRLSILKQATIGQAEGDDPTSMKVRRTLVNDVVGALQSLTMIDSRAEQFCWVDEYGATRRNYIALENGILDIDAVMRDEEESECLLRHSPHWFSSVCLPYQFDAAAECPRWDAFLQKNLEGDEERIALLQEWAGYLLVADTGQQRFLALEGEGSNGKSVFLAGIQAMIGVENVSHVNLELFHQRFALTQTLGKLANICADVGEIDKLAEGHLKSFTSGDAMFFDRKNRDGVTGIPTARLMISFNTRPRFSDRSNGVWRRMLLVPWRVEVQEEEKVRNMDKAAWWEASGELPGILRWAIVGLAKLRQRGAFLVPKICQDAIEDYRNEANPARAFLSEFYEAGTRDDWIFTTEIYTQYTDWCKACGFHSINNANFGREVARLFKKSTKEYKRSLGNRAQAYFGIRRSNNTEDQKEQYEAF